MLPACPPTKGSPWCSRYVLGQQVLNGIGTQLTAPRAGEYDRGIDVQVVSIHACKTMRVGFASGVHRSLRPLPMT